MRSRIVTGTKSLILCCAVLSQQPPAASQTHEWSQSHGGSGTDAITAASRDSENRRVIAGHYAGTIDLGGGAFVSSGELDNFIAKYEASGAHLWSRNLVGSENAIITSLAVDDLDQLILVGYAKGTINLGGDDLVSGFRQTSFAAKYDTDGNHIWSRHIGSVGLDDLVGDAEFDASGNFFAAGRGLLGNSSLAKFDTAGNEVWRNDQGAVGYGVAVDALGAPWVAGVFSYSTQFGDSLITGVGILDGFLASYSPGGTLLSALTYNDNSWCGSTDVAVDSEGNVWLAGFFSGILDLGAGVVQGGGGFDAFLTVFDPNGVPLCTEAYGSSGNDGAAALESGGNIALTGSFSTSVDLGGGVLISAGATDVFVVGYDGPCDHAWSRSIGGSGSDEPYALDLGQGVMIAGSFEDTVDFGGGPIASAGGSDGFVMNLLTPATAAPSNVLASALRLRSFPNPLNPATRIEYSVPTDGPVTLALFDARGRLVDTPLRNVETAAGRHALDYTPEDLSSGVYYLRLIHSSGETSQRVALLK